MGEITFEGTGLNILDYDSQSFEFESNDCLYGITLSELLEKASGTDSVGIDISGLSLFGRTELKEAHREDLEHYRTSHPDRLWPPVLKIKIQVIAEELNPEETEKWWKSRFKKNDELAKKDVVEE